MSRAEGFTKELLQRRDRPDLVTKNPDPKDFLDVPRAVALIRDARKIVVFGDADCDGVCGTAILYDAISSIGKDAVPYVAPKGYSGYGFSLKDWADIKKAYSPDLVVTVDCGITDHEAIREARMDGCKVLVVDHHTPGASLPPANTVVRPLRNNVCGAGLALILARSLEGVATLPQVAMAAIATTADVMNINHENRWIVMMGLESLNAMRKKDRRFHGLTALMAEAGILGQQVYEHHLQTLAAIINAACRFDQPEQALHGLLAEDNKEATIYIHRCQLLRRKRWDIEKKALEKIRKGLVEGDAIHLVIGNKGDWPHGVRGVIANRLVEETQKPVVVLNKEDKVVYGSGRAPDGVPLFETLEKAVNYEEFGGHPQAVGFHFKKETLPDFIDHMADLAVSMPRAELVQPYDRAIHHLHAVRHVWSETKAGRPYGHGNPEPVFLTEKVVPLSVYRYWGKRFWAKVSQGGYAMTAMGYSEARPSFPNYIDLVYSLRPDSEDPDEIILKVLDWRASQ